MSQEKRTHVSVLPHSHIVRYKKAKLAYSNAEYSHAQGEIAYKKQRLAQSIVLLGRAISYYKLAMKLLPEDKLTHHRLRNINKKVVVVHALRQQVVQEQLERENSQKILSTDKPVSTTKAEQQENNTHNVISNDHIKDYKLSIDENLASLQGSSKLTPSEIDDDIANGASTQYTQNTQIDASKLDSQVDNQGNILDVKSLFSQKRIRAKKQNNEYINFYQETE